VRLWVLGSGTLRPDALRGGAAFWVEAGPTRLLMDCGPGMLRTLARLGLPWQEVTHILLSHFHTDHVADLAPLLFAFRHGLEHPRREPLRILGPRGLGEHLRRLSGAHGAYVTDPGFPLVVEELHGAGAGSRLPGGTVLEARPTLHTDSSLAFRIGVGGVSLGYTGDTGPDEGLGTFFRGCGVLVAECSFPDEQAMDTHLTPAGLADLAEAASPEVLITTHAYPPLDPETVPGLLADAGYVGVVLAGRDGMRATLGESGVVVDMPGGHLRGRNEAAFSADMTRPLRPE
jgi:ribonuclease BN (tRNA processing enzyme)